MCFRSVLRMMMRRRARAINDEEAPAAASAAALADLAHELQTPITIIRGNFALLKPFVPQEMALAASAIENALEAMTKLAARVLLGASLDAAPGQAAQHEAISVPLLLREVAEDCRALGKEKGVRIFCQNAASPLFIKGDRHQVKEVLLNLISNALKHTPAGGTISLAAENKGGMAEIAVADSGSGIPEEFLPHIFERFYRIRDDASPGTGIGLHLSRKIAEAHGGRITAESSQGKGSRFVVAIPRYLL